MVFLEDLAAEFSMRTQVTKIVKKANLNNDYVLSLFS